MTSRLIVTHPGPFTTVQDLGRRGFRRYGVPVSGALHPDLARIANALADNGEDAPLLEFCRSGPTLRAAGKAVRVACTGDVEIVLTRNGRRALLCPWRTVTLEEGDLLRLGMVFTGRAGYLAVSGGLALEKIMGSGSTCLLGRDKSLGGLLLRKGQVLSVGRPNPPAGPERYLPRPPGRDGYGGPDPGCGPDDPVAIRVIPGPQVDRFTDETLAGFYTGVFTVTRDAGRTGSRLAGPRLLHRKDLPPEIVSDAMVPGAIQVPGNGAPIVMLADGPTVGGYPKIAAVASVDLPRFASLEEGRRVRFHAVTAEKGADLLLERRRHLATQIASIAPLTLVGDRVDLTPLFGTAQSRRTTNDTREQPTP